MCAELRRSHDPRRIEEFKRKSEVHQKSMDQTLEAKMLDENNDTFKHDTVYHELRTVVTRFAWCTSHKSNSHIKQTLR